MPWPHEISKITKYIISSSNLSYSFFWYCKYKVNIALLIDIESHNNEKIYRFKHYSRILLNPKTDCVHTPLPMNQGAFLPDNSMYSSPNMSSVKWIAGRDWANALHNLSEKYRCVALPRLQPSMFNVPIITSGLRVVRFCFSSKSYSSSSASWPTPRRPSSSRSTHPTRRTGKQFNRMNFQLWNNPSDCLTFQT